MTAREFFALPTRVSRLYPLLALGFMLSSGALAYTWQNTQISSDSTATKQDQEINTLKAQVDLLQSLQKSDQSTLKIQKQKIDASTLQLQALQNEMKAKADDLAQKATQLKQAQDQLKNQQDQLSKNADELEKLRTRPPLFNFKNESRIADVDQKIAEVKDVLTKAFPYITDMVGAPYALNSIGITFVDNFSIAGSSGEIVIENGPNGININIHLKDFDSAKFDDDNTIIHETVHGVAGVAVLEDAPMEEGRTVAVTDAVMERMIQDGKLPGFSPLYLTINDAQYNEWNQTLQVYKDSTSFYTDSNVSKVYQLIGTAWMRLYRQDPLFFKKLSDAYYPKVQHGLTPDTPLIKDIIRGIIPSVNGVAIDTYLANNRAFNPN